MKNFNEIIKETAIVEPNSQNLNDYQLETLTAARMRDLGDLAYEAVVEAPTFDEVVAKIIKALENPTKRQELFQQIGELLINGAIAESKSTINKAMNAFVDHLSLQRQFYEYEKQSYKHAA